LAPPSWPLGATLFGQRVLSSATPSVLGDFTHHPISGGKRWRNSPAGGWGPGLRHPLVYPGDHMAGPKDSGLLRRRKPDSAFLADPPLPRPPAPQPYFPGGACKPRATLPRAAGPPGVRRPGKPRRDPCQVLCTEREHGGTQAASGRSGSPRKAWREGRRRHRTLWDLTLSGTQS